VMRSGPDSVAADSDMDGEARMFQRPDACRRELHVIQSPRITKS
jgi:hypothetical protein